MSTHMEEWLQKPVHKAVALPKDIHHRDVEGVRSRSETCHIDGLWKRTCGYKAVNWSAHQPWEYSV